MADLKRTRHAGRHFLRQADGDVVLFQPRIDASGVDRGDKRSEDPLTGEILGRNFAIGIGRGDQQEGHKGQQAGHHRIEVKLTPQARPNPHRDEEGHHAHAEVKRQHQLFAVGLGEIQPAAGEAVGGIRRKRREDKHQHKRADDHKRQRSGKAVADGNHILLLTELRGQRRN